MDNQLWITLVVKNRQVISFVVPPTQSVYLGRDENANDIVLHDAQVSRMHAKIVARGDGYAVQDLHSSAGTAVNGLTIESTTLLEDSDIVTIGPYALRVNLRQWKHTEADELTSTIVSVDVSELGKRVRRRHK